MILRPLEPADLQSVLFLENQGMSNPWSEKMIREELANAHSFGYGAPNENRLNGFVLARMVADEGEILRITVSSPQRRGGIGSSLLHAVLAELTARQAQTCFLEMRAGNTPAQALYTALGFTLIGCRKGYYAGSGEDALILQKDLSAGVLRPGAADENNSRFGHHRQATITPG